MRLREISVPSGGNAHPHLYLRRYGYTTDDSDNGDGLDGRHIFYSNVRTVQGLLDYIA